MKAMICKIDEEEYMFFDCDTLDDLLDKLDERGYPVIQITLEDDEHGKPRMSIEVMKGERGA